jgi:hypothetical protein
MMEIPHARWYPAIAIRRSRRLFDPTPIPAEFIGNLTTVCNEFRPYSSARSVLISRSPDNVFKGAIGHYGKIKGTPACVAFIGDMRDPHIQEKVGYTGEGIILEATVLGLGTCWVGGFFRPQVAASLAHCTSNEKVLAVTPIGFPAEKVSLEERIMTGFGKTHKRKPLFELLTEGQLTILQEWVQKALEAARLAPSAVNRQPWRFSVSSNSITVSTDDLHDSYHISKRMDCGIAMLHIETAAIACGVMGGWEFHSPPEVAQFTVRK